MKYINMTTSFQQCHVYHRLYPELYPKSVEKADCPKTTSSNCDDDDITWVCNCSCHNNNEKIKQFRAIAEGALNLE